VASFNGSDSEKRIEERSRRRSRKWEEKREKEKQDCEVAGGMRNFYKEKK